MASYKVSYKLLRQQGEDLKAVAKLVDGCSERVAQVSAKLGEGELLAEVRTNLARLREQLTESRTVLQIAGDFLVKSVEGYTGVEVRQVKKADGTKAHQRDFYKNPVVVASVGRVIGGAGVAAATPASAPNVTYVDNSVNVNYVAVEAAPVAAPVEVAAPAAVPAVGYASAPAPAVAPAVAAAPVATPAASAGAGSAAGIAAGAGVLGGALDAGAVMGVKHLLDEDRKAKDAPPAKTEADASAKNAQAAAPDEYDPEKELAKALQRVRDLEVDDG